MQSVKTTHASTHHTLLPRLSPLRRRYAKEKRIPYSYWLADSWWYYRGNTSGGGVTNWTARPDIFPDGFEYLTKTLGWPVQGHNRFWDRQTVYAKQNGGRYDFLFDMRSGYALPTTQVFWDDLMRNATRWGLRVYEQDWLDDEFDHFSPLTQSATLGTQWLAQMAEGASKSGLTIQYCMSYPRHILASVGLRSVTQARASGDYHPGANKQWSQLGTTSLFAYALGIAPSKDNYWSTADQPGSWKHYKDHPREPYSRLQAAVVTLTKGPVAPSDAVNHSDVGLIMKSCASDGTLLQPSVPAMKLDHFLMKDALEGNDEGMKTSGEVWSAKSTIGSMTFTVLFSAKLKSQYEMQASRFGPAAGNGYVAIEANASSTSSSSLSFTRFGGNGSGVGPSRTASSLTLQPTVDVYNFEVWNVSPIASNGWALLGEVSKWVMVSPSRVVAVTEIMKGGLSVTVKGEGGEAVEMAFAAPGATKAQVVKCVIDASGLVTMSVPEGSCA